MDRRLLYGVVVPLAIALLLIALSASDIGLSAGITVVKQADRAALVGAAGASVPLETVSVDNGFFLPRKYALPHVIACLENSSSPGQLTGTSLSYAVGTDAASPSYPMGYSREAVDLGPYTSKVVQISLQNVDKPYLPDGQAAFPYDTVLVMNLDSSRSVYGCYDVTPGDVAGALRIPIR